MAKHMEIYKEVLTMNHTNKNKTFSNKAKHIQLNKHTKSFLKKNNIRKAVFSFILFYFKQYNTEFDSMEHVSDTDVIFSRRRRNVN